MRIWPPRMSRATSAGCRRMSVRIRDSTVPMARCSRAWSDRSEPTADCPITGARHRRKAAACRSTAGLRAAKKNSKVRSIRRAGRCTSTASASPGTTRSISPCTSLKTPHLLDEQRATFRRTLFVLLAALGIGLLALLLATLRWSLRPLRRVAQDLMRVEYGEREHLSDDYPTELARLAGNLNDFIDSEREHLQRYRNTLADLAHSLKTPLAVLRSQLELSRRIESAGATALDGGGAGRPHGRDRRLSVVARGDLRAHHLRGADRHRAVRGGSRFGSGKNLRVAQDPVRIRYRCRRAFLRRTGRSAGTARQPARKRVQVGEEPRAVYGASAGLARRETCRAGTGDRRRRPRHSGRQSREVICNAACVATSACRVTASAWPSCSRSTKRIAAP